MTAFCSRHPLACASAGVALLTVVLTWPQAAQLGTAFAAHQDPYFSTWRIAWIAHALTTAPRHLFDGNILYPLPRTLAMSDATMVEGALGAPLFWAGLAGVTVYNLLLLGGIAASGVAMFALAHHLTRSATAAFVAAAVFTMAPYRIEHYMHLELQWTAWMPLAFLAAHRTVMERSWRFGLLTGVAVWLQLLSSVYYGVYLGMLLAVFCVAMFATHPRRAGAAAVWLALGAALAGALVLPYAQPYIENARALGPRDPADIQRLSATLTSYLASPPQNLVWGWTADRFGAMELRLFPGLVATLLALIGLAGRPRRIVAVWAVVLAAAVLLSFGLNAPVYRWLYHHVWALGGFRAPSRFGILVICALGVLAAFGVGAIERRLSGAARPALLAGIVLLLIAEYWSAPMFLVSVPRGVPEVYRFLSRLPPAPIVELPLPALNALPGFDPEFEFWSTTHWRPLVNGYSGYFPAPYADTITRMRHFPDTPSIARLRELNVKYVIVHEWMYTTDEVTALLTEMLRRPMLLPTGRYRDWKGWAVVFELR